MDGLFLYDTEIGRIAIGENGGAIALLRLPGEEVPGTVVQHETELLRKAAEQLREYLRGERKMFDLPLAPEGTAFQKAVWSALQEIPYGQTRSYGEIAARIGRPKACRAVGMANHCNPIPIFIPCHRVVGANGSLTGYAGGLNKKIALLGIEGIDVDALSMPKKGVAL